MSYHDKRGLLLTTVSPDAATGFDQVIDEFLDYELSASRTLKSVIEADGEFVMGHVLRGYLLSMLETTAIRPKLDAAQRSAAENADGASMREQMHVTALGHVATGDALGACLVWETILAHAPHDLLALKMHHYTSFWTGRTEALRSQAVAVDAAWSDTLPGYGYVLGMQAFGFEETGDLDRAERLGRKAVELNAEDLWARHAVAHVLESAGRAADGIAWLDIAPERLTGKNPFAGHLWWHKALFELELGSCDAAIALYDERIRASSTDFYLDVQNMASLLQRLELLGVNTGDRWQELAEHAAQHIDDHALAFTDIHNILALAATDADETATRMIDSMRSFASTPDNWAAATMTRTTVPLAEAIAAYGRGDYPRAVTGFLRVRHDLAPVGGSHAQRDLFTQMLIQAACNSGNHTLARSLLAERLALRPGSAHHWSLYAGILDALGEGDRAELARAHRLH